MNRPALLETISTPRIGAIPPVNPAFPLPVFMRPQTKLVLRFAGHSSIPPTPTPFARCNEHKRPRQRKRRRGVGVEPWRTKRGNRRHRHDRRRLRRRLQNRQKHESGRIRSWRRQQLGRSMTRRGIIQRTARSFVLNLAGVHAAIYRVEISWGNLEHSPFELKMSES